MAGGEPDYILREKAEAELRAERTKFRDATGYEVEEWLALWRDPTAWEKSPLGKTPGSQLFSDVAVRLEAETKRFVEGEPPKSPPRDPSAPLEFATPTGRAPQALAAREARERLKKRKGRKTKLSEALRAKVVEIIRDGNFRNTAAAIVGVSEDQFSRWMIRGAKEQRGPYREFYLAVIGAEGEAESSMVALVKKAAVEDARHAEWWLARKHPGNWARKDQLQISSPEGGPVEVSLARDLLLERLEKIAPKPAPAPAPQPAEAAPGDAGGAGAGSPGPGDKGPPG